MYAGQPNSPEIVWIFLVLKEGEFVLTWAISVPFDLLAGCEHLFKLSIKAFTCCNYEE